MSLKEWKNNEINTRLMKKWGLLKESTENLDERSPTDYNREKGTMPVIPLDKQKEEAEDIEEGHEHGPECGCPDMEEGMQYRADDESHEDESDNMEDNQFGMGDPLKRDKLEEDSEGEETYHYGEAEGHDEKELHDLVKRHATKSHIDALKRDMDYDEDHEDRHERGTDFREGKISVREAKEITRRIIERIRKGDK